MILYNVTIKIDRQTTDEWRDWMLSTHIPDVMACKIFTSYTMSKLLFQDDGDGDTFVIQYTCPDMEMLNTYFSDFAPALQKDHTARYKDKFVAFRTIMEVLSTSK